MATRTTNRANEEQRQEKLRGDELTGEQCWYNP
jgi:hypothetical protein